MKHLFAVLLLLGTACAQEQVAGATQISPDELAHLAPLYHAAAVSFVATDFQTEYSFTEQADGSFSKISSSNEHWHNRVTLYNNTVAIFHTHPKDCSPRPSQDDIDVAKKNHVLNYVLSIYALWVAEPDGTVEKVGNVEIKHGKVVIE